MIEKHAIYFNGERVLVFFLVFCTKKSFLSSLLWKNHWFESFVFLYFFVFGIMLCGKRGYCIKKRVYRRRRKKEREEKKGTKIFMFIEIKKATQKFLFLIFLRVFFFGNWFFYMWVDVFVWIFKHFSCIIYKFSWYENLNLLSRYFFCLLLFLFGRRGFCCCCIKRNRQDGKERKKRII